MKLAELLRDRIIDFLGDNPLSYGEAEALIADAGEDARLWAHAHLPPATPTAEDRGDDAYHDAAEPVIEGRR